MARQWEMLTEGREGRGIGIILTMIDFEKEFGKPERAVGAWQTQIARILRFLGKER